MSNNNSRTYLIALALILPLGGCVSPGERGPAREEIIEYGTPSEPLSCPRPGVAARADTQVVGMEGGTLRSGSAELTIPPGALLDRRQLILSHDESRQTGMTVGARIDAEEPVQFQNNLSARLVFDVSGCDRQLIESSQGWWVWRLNPVEGRSQKLSTLINARRAITAIDSTSVFLIAN